MLTHFKFVCWFQDLIRQMLVVNPSDRLSSRKALSHPWIRTEDHILDQRDLTNTVEEMKKVRRTGVVPQC